MILNLPVSDSQKAPIDALAPSLKEPTLDGIQPEFVFGADYRDMNASITNGVSATRLVLFWKYPIVWPGVVRALEAWLHVSVVGRNWKLGFLHVSVVCERTVVARKVKARKLWSQHFSCAYAVFIGFYEMENF